MVSHQPWREPPAPAARPGMCSQHGREPLPGSKAQRTFTARATTRVARTSEMSDSEIIISFAHLLRAETSVGPKAVAVLNDRAREPANGGSEAARRGWGEVIAGK